MVLTLEEFKEKYNHHLVRSYSMLIESLSNQYSKYINITFDKYTDFLYNQCVLKNYKK